MDGSQPPKILDEDFWDGRPPAEGESLAEGIARRINEIRASSTLTPAQMIAFQGAARMIDRNLQIEQLSVTALGGAASVPPLEFMRFQSRGPISEYQYLGGVLFRSDFEAANRTSSMSANYEAGQMFQVDGIDKQRAEYKGPGAKRGDRIGSVPVARLDAMKRMGRFLDRNPLSFTLALEIIGHEFTCQQVARAMGEDDRYIGRRFREALDDLAAFYGLLARGGKYRGQTVWHNPDVIVSGPANGPQERADVAEGV